MRLSLLAVGLLAVLVQSKKLSGIDRSYDDYEVEGEDSYTAVVYAAPGSGGKEGKEEREVLRMSESISRTTALVDSYNPEAATGADLALHDAIYGVWYGFWEKEYGLQSVLVNDDLLQNREAKALITAASKSLNGGRGKGKGAISAFEAWNPYYNGHLKDVEKHKKAWKQLGKLYYTEEMEVLAEAVRPMYMQGIVTRIRYDEDKGLLYYFDS